jgi:hypothetical protein
VARRHPNQEVVNARVAVAKARLALLAAEVDARPGLAEQALGLVRRRPWQGLGLALAAGVLLGVGRGRSLRALVPLAAPLLVELASVRGPSAARSASARRDVPIR